MRNSKTNELVLTGLFTAIIIIMAFTPLGYIPLVVINATIIHIPVILGSLFCGPKKGAFLGFVFGFTSCLKATIVGGTLSSFVFSPLYKTIIILQSFFVYIAKCFVAIHRLCTSSCIGNGLCHDIGTHWPHQIDIGRHTAH